MDLPADFMEPPKVVWHGRRPFALARLPVAYARLLTEVALQHEQRIVELPVAKGWEKAAPANPTSSRYASYNVFLMDPRCLSLFFALRQTYRFLLAATGEPAAPRYVQGWMNVHRKGQHIHRHSHDASYIAVFSACAEGSETSFGPFPVRTEHDRAFGHHDGQILVTTGPGNYHEVSPWLREDMPRVTYAFDLYDAGAWSPKNVLVPFDADVFPTPVPAASPPPAVPGR